MDLTTVFICVLSFMLFIIMMLLHGKSVKDFWSRLRYNRQSKKTFSELFPKYIHWKTGDEILYAINEHNDSIGVLQTFSNKEVILIDKNVDKSIPIIIKPYQIKENTTYDLRSSLEDSVKFHTESVPEMRKYLEGHDTPEERALVLRKASESEEASVASVLLKLMEDKRNKNSGFKNAQSVVEKAANVQTQRISVDVDVDEDEYDAEEYDAEEMGSLFEVGSENYRRAMNRYTRYER